MDLFEKDGEVYKRVPAGGTGGGVTSFATVKASEAEAAGFRASQAREAEAAAEQKPEAEAPTATAVDATS